MFSIKSFQVGPIEVNCYILKDNASNAGLVIDPGDEAEIILHYIRENNIDVKLIVNTHGHFDHIGANDKLRKALGVELAIHEADASMLTSARENLSAFMGVNAEFKSADKLLKDGDKISFGGCTLKVIHTPGHTLGGICLYDGEKTLFSGDTLFAGSVGRTDFPNGSHSEIVKSVKERLVDVKDDVTVLPGHGPSTQMGYERRTNPYF